MNLVHELIPSSTPPPSIQLHSSPLSIHSLYHFHFSSFLQVSHSVLPSLLHFSSSLLHSPLSVLSTNLVHELIPSSTLQPSIQLHSLPLSTHSLYHFHSSSNPISRHSIHSVPSPLHSMTSSSPPTPSSTFPPSIQQHSPYHFHSSSFLQVSRSTLPSLFHSPSPLPSMILAQELIPSSTPPPSIRQHSSPLSTHSPSFPHSPSPPSTPFSAYSVLSH